ELSPSLEYGMHFWPSGQFSCQGVHSGRTPPPSGVTMKLEGGLVVPGPSVVGRSVVAVELVVVLVPVVVLVVVTAPALVACSRKPGVQAAAARSSSASARG